MNLSPWTYHVHLHPDVQKGETSIATYAIDLGAMAANDLNVPLVYRDPERFFAATYLTEGLRDLLQEVLSRLAGGEGDRVLQLHSPFGGGKSHTLAALYHAARNHDALQNMPECPPLANPGAMRIAVFDGEKFDVQGRIVNGIQTQTMWGMLAAQLDCYEIVAYHDEKRVAPGGDKVAEILAGKPTLILMDEVLKYLVRSRGEVMSEHVGDTTLGALTEDFLQTLSVEVARTSNAVLVYSLQASSREAFGNEALLDSLDHLVSRVDAKREPVAGDEILPVLRRRLLAEEPPQDVEVVVAREYARQITKMRMAQALDEQTRQDAEDEQRALQERIEASYPFHPALIDIMRERWASLPDFQRTRGALRFLSVCLHVLRRDERADVLFGPAEIPIDDGNVSLAFFTEVGQRERFKAVIQSDFSGPNARVKRIDERLANEHPELSAIRPAMRLATAILAFSFGGLLHADDEGGEPIGSGVTGTELLAAVVRPGLDSLTAQGVLKQLRDNCLYLHYDGAKYVFKTTPNITHLIEQARVKKEDVEEKIEGELENRLRGRVNAILWPSDGQKIADREPQFLLAYLPLNFAFLSPSKQETEAKKLLTKRGEGPRRFRNGLGLVIPDRRQVELLRKAARNLLAIKKVEERRKQHNLTTSQMQQLKDRRQDEEKAFEAALRNLYQSIWLPEATGGEIKTKKVTATGRPLAQSGMHEKLMELLTTVPPMRVFTTLKAAKIPELMRLGSQNRSVRVGDLVESFYSVLSFPRLENEDVLRRAIAEGVAEGLFGYVRPGSVEVNQIKESSGYLVNAEQARISEALSEDELDMGESFIFVPGAIEPAAPAEIEEGETIAQPGIETPQGGEVSVPGYETTQTPDPVGNKTTAVRLRLRMTRQQVYASVNAISNLASEAGVIDVTVEANKLDGFDPSWLQNAVLEPLDEADVDVEEL